MERYHIFKLGLAVLFYAVYCIRPMVVNGLKIDDNNETRNLIEEDFVYYQGVQGKPGVDFPVLSHIPRTTFNCRNVDSGYYADLETDCQVFHICEDGKKISFLCPNGTIFQQSELICEWWFKVNCTSAPSLYEESAEQLREENAKRKASRRVFNHGAVMRTEERSSVSASQNGRSFETRRRDRINNHSPTYRENEDLARASSSDFVRDGHKPAPFSTSSPPKSGFRQRQNLDSQQARNGARKPVPFRKTDNNQFRNRNQQVSQQSNGFGHNRNNQGTGFRHVNNFNEEFGSEAENKPVNNGFQQQFDSDFGDDTNGFGNHNQETRTNDQNHFTNNQNRNIGFNNQQSRKQQSNSRNQFRNRQHSENKPAETGFQPQFDSGFGHNGFDNPNQLNEGIASHQNHFTNQNVNNNEPTNNRNTDTTQQSRRQHSEGEDRKPVSSVQNESSRSGFANQFTENKPTGFQPQFTSGVGHNTASNGFDNQSNQSQNQFTNNQNLNSNEPVSNRNQVEPSTDTTTTQQSAREDRKLVSSFQNEPSVNSRNNGFTKPTGFQSQFDSGFGHNAAANGFDNPNHSNEGQNHFTVNQNLNSNEPVSNRNNQVKPTTESTTTQQSKQQQSEREDRKLVYSFQNEPSVNSRNNGFTNQQSENKPTGFQSQFESGSGHNAAANGFDNPNHSNEGQNHFTVNQNLNSNEPVSNRNNQVKPTTESTTTQQSRKQQSERGDRKLVYSFQNEPSINSRNNGFANQIKQTTDFKNKQQSANRNNQETRTQQPNEPIRNRNGGFNNHAEPTDSTTKQQPNSERGDRKLVSTSFQQQNQFTNNQKFDSNIANSRNTGFQIKQTTDFKNKEQSANRNTQFGHNKTVSNKLDQQQNQPTDIPNTDNSDFEEQEPSPGSGFQNHNYDATTDAVPSFHFPGNCTFAAHFHQQQQKPVVPISTSFPNLKDEAAFNTNTQKQNAKVLPLANTHKNVEGKGGTTKQKSTVPLTRNDIVNRRLEPNESDEAQITQETASFYKNSFNKIDQNYKSTSPHPNHRETYSELKEPKYYSTKILSAISSVTPQYLTTQSINNGKPFIGSQVGTTLSRNLGTTTTTVEPTTTVFVVGRTDFNDVTTSNPTTTIPTTASTTTSTRRPKIEGSTKRIVDHATVYGKFVKSSATSPSPGKLTISLSKSLIGGTSNKATPNPLSIRGSTPKTSSEILSTSHSSNSAVPQVRFFGKVNGGTTTKSSRVEVRVNGNSISTTPKPRFSSTLPTYINSFSSTPKPFSVSEKVPTSVAPFSTSPLPLSISTAQSNSFTPFSTTPRPFVSTASSGFSYLGTTLPSNNIPTTATTLSANSIGTTTKSGFYVTKDVGTTGKSIVGDIVRPRPFQLPPEPAFKGQAVYTSTKSATPTHPTYKISSASPFTVPPTPQPTQPTPFSTAKPALATTFENVDTMINALAEMASQDHSGDSPRPGLVIPPSAGPQTLHTLAQYFANALDGIDKEEDDEDEDDEENLTAKELEKKRVTELLTQMTMNRYNELFSEEKEEEATTVASRSRSDEEDLEGQHSKNPAAETPKVRQLAKVFTQALSSYLDDPATFRKVLEEVRPTEPPALEETTDFGDDELLNFSDADVKSSYPPFFPTPRPPKPTWGYLVAFNTSLDVKNSINGENENLQGADSQSFVSQLNKLQQSKETTTKSSLQLPEDHWTTSPGVTKLWKSAFSFDPASINENFGTTEAAATTTEQDTEVPQLHHEIKYELRALPQLDLNSTQVHGILIDFMNTTRTNHENRLQRILRKLNTTEDEFLTKMKEIEGNPLTRRLILLLISECRANATAETHAVPLHALLERNLEKNREILETSSSVAGFASRQRVETQTLEKSSSDLKKIVDASLDDDSQDARALQLLNSLYTIASRFGKK